MMGDYHVRFRERFRGETPLYLLDFDHGKGNYFYKDPNYSRYQIGDILSQEEITEYIVFNEYTVKE